MPVRLLNNAWQVVNLEYRAGNLTLSAGGQQQVCETAIKIFI